jgi:hypothetical protein
MSSELKLYTACVPFKKEKEIPAGCRWLTPVVRQRLGGGGGIRDCSLKPAQANSSRDPISKKPSTLDWFKVKALRSSPSTVKRKRMKYQKMLAVVDCKWWITGDFYCIVLIFKFFIKYNQKKIFKNMFKEICVQLAASH